MIATRLSKLYKTSKSGAIEEWMIHYNEDSNGAYYEVEFGQEDGLKQTKRNYVSGKNLGKANETSNLKQAKLEAESRWKRQIDKGYTLTKGAKSDTILPMLAHSYKDHKDKISFPCYVQPKLDGVRCLARRVNGKVTLFSRKGKIYNVPHIEAQLETVLIGDNIFDGELYIHGETFQNIVSWIKKKRQETNLIEYHVYDYIHTKLSYHERKNHVWLLKDVSSHIFSVKTIRCYDEDALTAAHKKFVQDGYEGSIIRHGEQGYEVNFRSHYLLKRKDFITEEFEIVGAEENINSPGQCSFILKTDKGCLFNCKPEGTASYREQLWKDHKKYIGKLMTVRFFEWSTSTDSVPRFPVGTIIRDYE